MERNILKKNHNKWKRTAAILLVLAFSVLTLPCSKIFAGEDNSEIVHIEKDETIYASLSSSGTVEKIIAVNHLNRDKNGNFTDRGKYVDEEITLLTSDTSYMVSDGNYIFTSEDDIKNLYYRGNPENKELPFSFSIKYSLDGETIDAQQLAGETGRVGISIDIRSNSSSHEYFRNNYICQISIPISLSVFSDISVSNAQRVVAGSEVTYTFMVLPSSSKQIQLEALAEGFEIGSFSIACIPFSISSFLGEDIPFTPADLDTLADAAGQLESGTKQLAAGLTEFGKALNELSSSAEELTGSQQDIYSGYSDYLDSITQLTGGILQLSDGLTLTASQGHVLADSFTDLKENITTVFDSLLPLTATLPSEQSAEITGSIQALKTGMDEFDSALREYTGAIQTISENAENMSSGMSAALEGATGLRTGMGKLKDGMYSFSQGISQMNNEFRDIEDGAKSLSNGQTGFNDGLRESVGLLDKFTSPEYEGMPVSFVNSDATCSSVQFVLTTPEITMANAGTAAPEPPEGKSFWQKFLELFTGIFNK